MAKPTAKKLHDNYPKTSRPCIGGYVNQCAIRLSIALEASGVSLSRYTGNKCLHGHARGAQGLANYLRRIWGRPTWIYIKNKSKAKTLLATHRGVIFFKNCFTRRGQAGRWGDHIDVWYGGKAMTYEDFTGSDAVWFWKLV